jgi:hypothetical protein
MYRRPLSGSDDPSVQPEDVAADAVHVMGNAVLTA